MEYMIAGTALGILNGTGGLGNILGGCGTNGCSDNIAVNRYEMAQQKELFNKDMEIAYLKGREAARADSLELHQYVDGRFREVEAQLAGQAVVNAQTSSLLSCMQQTINTLSSLTKTVVPISSVCPEPMPLYNSFTAPTTSA